MSDLEILHQDVLEKLIVKELGEKIEERHNDIYNYVSVKIGELKEYIWKEYKNDRKHPFQKDKKATLDNFLEGFTSTEWKKFFKYRGGSTADLRRLLKNCLVESSATKNLLDGHSIALKSKDFYSVYLDYEGWNDFTLKKLKNRDHRNKKSTLPKELTVKFPKLLKNQIVGRESEIEDLHKRLFDNKQVVLVNGMGGIGKTTVASVYATEYLPEYKHIAWISQVSGDFQNDLINAQGLLIGLKIDTTGKTSQQLFDEIVMKLKSIKDSPCLMVIDNANEELYKFYDLLPSPNWHILVTSREIIPHFDTLKLGFLSEDKAIELFEKLYERDDFDRATVIKIVEYVDYHTLTIEILALTAKRQGLPLEVILTAIEENIEAGVIIKHSKEKIEKITSYLCFIFENISELSNDEKWLLVQFSCLPSEFHSEDLLQEYIQPEEKMEKVFKLLLSDLSDKGWILYNKENDDYKMHRIIIEVINKETPLKVETVKPLLFNISSKIASIYKSKDDPKFKDDNFIVKFRKWVPFGKAILNRFKTNKDVDIEKLQNDLALALQELGGKENLIQAKKLLEKAVDAAKKNFGEHAPLTATRYSNLALTLQELGGKGNLQQAKFLLEKTIDADEKNFSKQAPTMAISHSNLAMVLRELGGKENFLQAKFLLEKAIDTDEKNFGKQAPTTAISYANLALVLQDLGGKENLFQAKALLEKAIDSDEKNFGEQGHTTAARYSNLALVIQDLGGKENLLQAKNLLEKAIDADEKNFGQLAPYTAVNYANLAMVLRNLGGKENLLQAKFLLEKAIDANEKNFGKLAPKTAISYSNMALVLRDLGGEENLLQSKILLEKSIDFAEKNFGENAYIKGAHYYSNLALVLKDLGGEENLLKAKNMLEKSIDIGEKKIGENSPTMVIRYSNLAMVLKDLGGGENLLQAKTLLEKSINIDEKNFGNQSPNMAIRYSNLALVLQSLKGDKNLNQARNLLEKSIDSAEKNFGEDAPITAMIYTNLATVLMDLGGNENLHQAKFLLEKSISSEDILFGKQAPTWVLNYSNLAIVLQALGEKEDLLKSKILVEELVNFSEKKYGMNHPNTKIVRVNLERLSIVIQILYP